MIDKAIDAIGILKEKTLEVRNNPVLAQNLIFKEFHLKIKMDDIKAAQKLLIKNG